MITVIDAIMGSGKTTYMTDLMNKLHTEAFAQSFADPSHESPRFLYVTPILTEVERVQKACSDLDFRDPKPVKGKKLNHLSSLIEEGANVCTTHALFRLLNEEIYAKLTDQNYTLVIDEVLDCVNLDKGLSLSDRTMLFETNKLYVEPDTNRLRWNHDQGVYSGEFNEVRDLCDNGNLILFNNTVLWEFPADFLHCFKQVYILTYLFNGSPMAAHLRANGLSYELMTLNSDNQLVSQDEDKGEAETKAKERYRNLINVYEGSANSWGEPKGKENPFSSTWYKRKPAALKGIKASLENWFKKLAKTPARHNAWTAFKEGKACLSGSPYAKGWIPCNAKGTNDHIERRSLAYLCNVFYNPIIKAYFEHRGIEVDEEGYALSEMIQWVWRSQIRRYDPITVFIPSERMRDLFVQWLDISYVVQADLACKDPMHSQVQSRLQTDVLHTPEANGRKLSLAEALRRHEQEQVH